MPRLEYSESPGGLIAMLRNFVGSLKGISGCGICGDKWNWKKEHIFPYEKGRGAFPICEECWRTASASQIKEATKQGTVHHCHAR